MKKNILIFLKSVIFVVALLIAVVYYVNFRAEGTTAYVTRGCIVYNSPDLSNPIDNLSVGEAVTSLVYHGNANKIRYTDDSGDTIVGFVSEHVLGYYVFPVDINCESVILTVSNKTDFNDFVSTLVSLDEEDFSLIGVYEDFSLKYSCSYGDLHKIQDFCEEQKIPFGIISDLNKVNYDDYISDKVSMGDLAYEYKILPYTFRIYNEDYINSSYDLTDCVIYTSSGESRDGFNSWITDLSSSSASQPRNSEILNKESIYAYKFYEDSEIDFSFISDDWNYDIGAAYKEIEDATRD